MKKCSGKIFSILFFVISVFGYGQNNNVYDPSPKIPKPTLFRQQIPLSVGVATPKPGNIVKSNSFFQDKAIQQRNQMLIQQANRNAYLRKQQAQIIRESIADMDEYTFYELPVRHHFTETKFYHEAFKKLNQIDPNNYDLKQADFIVENAFFNNQKDYEQFDKTIKQIGAFLRQKMDEFGYDKNSNLAKNFILFRFFSDTLHFNKKDLMHLPVNYDFDDAFGDKNWSNMFVTKLLETNKGQCSSMPRLYLILAEEINANAYLALSPNHSYIRFFDNGKWYNVELTNHMFTTDAMILNSGYIKAEALVNGVYMNNLTKKQVLAQEFVDLASGYLHKFGYEPFVKTIIEKALQLDPNSINANMLLSNYLTVRFEYVCKKLNINPRNHQDLQKIRFYPKVVQLLNEVNRQYQKIDNLGFEFMSREAYQKWLHSLKETQKNEKSKYIKNSLKSKLKINKFKN
jgi:hypothetical protein